MKVININLKEYLQNSLKSDDKTYCKGWEYLKENITTQLKTILNKKEYWDLKFNDQKVNFILKELKEDLGKDLKSQLGSFVYVRNDIKRKEEKQKEEQQLKEQLTKEGFTEILNTQKELNNKKVECVMEVTAIGILGSFDKITRIKGKLSWSDSYNCLFLIPQRCRTKGYMIKNKCYIKEE